MAFTDPGGSRGKAKPKRKPRPRVRPDATDKGYEGRKSVPRIPLVLKAEHRKKAVRAPAQYERGVQKRLPKQIRREVAAKAIARAQRGDRLTPVERRSVSISVENMKRRRLGVDVGKPLKSQTIEKRVAHATGTKTAAKRTRDVAAHLANDAIRQNIGKSSQARFDRDPDFRAALRLAARGKEREGFERLPSDLQKKVSKRRQAEFESSTVAGKLGIGGAVPDPVKRAFRTGVQTTTSVAKAVAADPKRQTLKFAKDAGTAVALAPAAIATAATAPRKTIKAIAKDYEERYGEVWRNEPGAVKRQTERLKKDGVFAEGIDLAAFGAPVAGTATGTGLRLGSKAAYKLSGGAGKTGRIDRYMASSRPGLQGASSRRMPRPQRTAHVRPIRRLKQAGLDKTRAAALARKEKQLSQTTRGTAKYAKLAAQVGQGTKPGQVRSLSSLGTFGKTGEKLSTFRAERRPLAKMFKRNEHHGEHEINVELTGKRDSLGAAIKNLDADQRNALQLATGLGIRSTTDPAEVSRLLNDWADRMEAKQGAKVGKYEHDLVPVARALAANPKGRFTPDIDALADAEVARGRRIGEGVGPADRQVEAQRAFLDAPRRRTEQQIKRAIATQKRKIKAGNSKGTREARRTLDKERAILAGLQEKLAQAQGRAEVLSRNVAGVEGETAAARAGTARVRVYRGLSKGGTRVAAEGTDYFSGSRKVAEGYADVDGTVIERSISKNARVLDVNQGVPAEVLQGLRARGMDPPENPSEFTVWFDRIGADNTARAQAIRDMGFDVIHGPEYPRKANPAGDPTYVVLNNKVLKSPGAGEPGYAGGAFGVDTARAAAAAQRNKVKIAERRFKDAAKTERSKVEIDAPEPESPSAYVDRIAATAGERGLAPGGFISAKATGAPEDALRSLKVALRKTPPIESKGINIERGTMLADPHVNVAANAAVIQYKAGQGFLHDVAENFAVRELPSLADPIPEGGLKRADLAQRIFEAGLEETADPKGWKYWGVVKAPGPGNNFNLVHKGVADSAEALFNPPKKGERLLSGFMTRWPSTLLLGTSPVWLGFQGLANLGQAMALGPSALIRLRKNIKLLKGLTREELAMVDLVGGTGPQHHIQNAGERVSTRYMAETSKLVRLYDQFLRPRGSDPFGLFRADHFQNTQFRRLITVDTFRRRLKGTAKVIDDNRLPLEQLKQLLADLDTPTHERLSNEAALNAYRSASRFAEEVGERTFKVLGDWTTYTALERKILKSNILFYGYLRFSLRLALYTMPIEHPTMTGILAQLGRLEKEELDELLGKDGTLPYMLGKWYLKNGNEVAINRLNPLTNVVTEIGMNLEEGPNSLLRLTPPFILALTEGVSGYDLVLGRNTKAVDPISGREIDINELQGGAEWKAKTRAFFNEIANLSVVYRSAREAGARETPEGVVQRRTDTSLPFDSQYAEVSPDRARYELEKARLRQQTPLQKLAGATVPLFPQPGSTQRIAEETRLRKLKEQIDEARKRATSADPLRNTKYEIDRIKADMEDELRDAYGGGLTPKEEFELERQRLLQEAYGG